MGLIDAINETNTKAVNVGERYIETTYKHAKLKLFKQITSSVSLVFKAMLIGSLWAIFTLISAIGLSLYVGKAIGSYPLGFVIVAAFFLLLSIIAFIFRKSINHLVVKKLSDLFFD